MRQFQRVQISVFALAAGMMFTGCVAKSKYLKEQDRANGLDMQLSQANKTNQDLTKTNQDLTQQLQSSQQSASQLAQQKSEQQQLVENLTNEIQSSQVKISEIAGKVSINMVDKILFDSGSAQLKENGKAVLDKVGSALKKVENKRIWVGGHTDDVAISPSLRDTFPTNWELSSARATAVVRYLQDKAGIPGERLLAVGQSQYNPVGDNKTPEGRAQNRRIEILLIPTTDTLKSIQNGQ